MKNSKERKNLMVAIVLLIMIIAGMILRSGASAKEELKDQKDAYDYHWLNEGDSLGDAMEAFIELENENDEHAHLYSLEWDERYGRWEVFIECDNHVVVHYVYDRRFTGEA